MGKQDPYQVIETVYDAVLDNNDWSTALSALLDFTKCEMGCVEMMDYATSDFHVLSYSGHPGTIYTNPPDFDWVGGDPWGNAVTPETISDIHVGSQLVSPDKYIKTEFCDVAKDFDMPIKDLVATASPIGKRALFTVALYRRDGQNFIDHHDVQDYALVHKHVQRALDLSFKFSDLRSNLSIQKSLSDSLPYAVFGLSHDGTIKLKNKPADLMLSTEQSVQSLNNRLHILSQQDDNKLQEAIVKAAGTYIGPDHALKVEASSFLLQREDAPPQSVLVFPVSKQFNSPVFNDVADNICVLVCIAEQQFEYDPRIQHLVDAYNLSQGEEKLLKALIQGQSLSDVASCSGRSVETLRSQLKSIFAKTECRSQMELLKLVLRAPSLF